jgi:DNA-binding LacI/PurR family transcriptional regulator
MARRTAAAPSLNDIARAAGVSARAVAYILNSPQADRFRPETRERVHVAAERLGYRPSSAARSVRSGRFGTVAVVANAARSSQPGGFLDGLHDALARQDLGLLLVRIGDEDFAHPDKLPRLLRERCCDALVVMHDLGSFPVAFHDALKDMQVPAVWFNLDLQHDAIMPDDHAGGYDAAVRLIAAGSRRLAWAGPADAPRSHASIGLRRSGCSSACAAVGMHLTIHDDPPAATGREGQALIAMWRAILSGPQAPDGVVTYGPGHAQAIALAARDLGRNFPGSPRIVTCAHHLDGDLGWWWSASYLPWRRFGAETAAYLVRRLATGSPLPPQRVAYERFDGHTI